MGTTAVPSAAAGLALAVLIGAAGPAIAETGADRVAPGKKTPVVECSLKDLVALGSNCLPAERGPRLPASEVIAKVTAAGYKDIFSIEFEHGRYEVEARTRTGRKVLIFVDPRSGRPRLKSYGWARLTGSFLPTEKIVATVEGAGYEEVFAVGREHAMYEVVARDSRGRLVKLHIHAKTGRLIRHVRSDKPFAMPVEARDAAGPYVPVPDLLALVAKAGYTDVFSLEPKGKYYQCIARDADGHLFLFLLDPGSGEVREHP